MSDSKKNTSETLARYFGENEEMDTVNINLAQLHASRSSRRGVGRGLAMSMNKLRKAKSEVPEE